MKKLFLLIAFTGIVGAASATTLVTSSPAAVVAVKGDPIKGDDKKKKEEKACCKKDADGKHTADANGKACSSFFFLSSPLIGSPLTATTAAGVEVTKVVADAAPTIPVNAINKNNFFMWFMVLMVVSFYLQPKIN